MIQPHIQFASFANKPGFLGVGNHPCRLSPGLNNNHVAHLQVLGQNQVDWVAFRGGFGTQVIGKFQLNVVTFLQDQLGICRCRRRRGT